MPNRLRHGGYVEGGRRADYVARAKFDETLIEFLISKTAVWATFFYTKVVQLVETSRMVPSTTLGAMAAKAPRQLRYDRSYR